MIIVRIIGGLGNQMFQYALYKSLEQKGKEVKIDISGFLNYGLHNGYELPNIFKISENIATQQEIELLSDHKSDLFNKMRRKITGRKRTHNIQEDFKFIPEVFELDHVYLDGYWQSQKYFIDEETTIRNSYKFNNHLDSRNMEIVSKMKQVNSVSIHVRRGDYITDPEANKVHGGITTLEYYKKSIKLIKERLDNPIFFVFSDDIEWVRQNMGLTNSYFIDWNNGRDSYKDMQLMSYCKHNIIANSSFSWWGAWLNQNESKIVIAPSKWFNTIDVKDVIPDHWIRVNVDEV